MEAWLDIPAAGVQNEYLGVLSLNELPQGDWSTVNFLLTPTQKQTLLGDFPLARLRLATNVGQCGQPVYVDNVRMGGSLTCPGPGDPGATEAVVSSSVLTFDEVADWNSVETLASDSENASQGSASLAFGPAHFTSIVSRPFATSELSDVSDRLAVDVYIPDLPPDYYWLGGANAFVECPSVGLYKTFLGYQALQILFEGTFNRIEFNLPSSVLQAFQTSANDCRFSFEVIQNPAYGQLALDGGGFIQENP